MAGYELRPEQSQRAVQELRLEPRMLQAIEVLQLPSFELSAYVERAAEENEALVVAEPRGESSEPRGPQPRAGGEASDRYDEWLQNQPDRAVSLAEHALDQLALQELDPDVAPWVHVVVAALDSNGYLSVDDDELFQMAADQGLAPDAALLGRAIAVVQSLEPRGIGGRDAVEALLLQLDPNEEDYELLCTLLEDFLDELARNRRPDVARALGIDLDRLQELIDVLRGLEVRPAASVLGSEAPAIRPDVLVEHVPGGGFEVRVERSGLPAVSIDEDVRALAADRVQPTEVRRYLKGKLERARWLVEAVEQRHHTLTRVAARLFEHQRAFIQHGPGHLVPLRMNALAEELGLAVSTISRTAAGKHAQTPWGVFSLRHFFQAGGGAREEVARDELRDAVGKVFANEDPKRPLSDDEVVAELRGKGIQLARRTVAKYRKELGLPSSYRRRKFA